MGTGIIRKLLAKRNESDFTKAGFFSGVVAGIVIGIFTFVVYIVNKQVYFNELESVKKVTQLPLPDETIWIISLVATPPLIVLIYSIVGIFLGTFFKRFMEKRWLIIVFSLLIGIIWGMITNLPVTRIAIMLMNILSWLAFGILFILLAGKKKEI